MSENTGTPEAQVETTSVFRADLLKEMETGATASENIGGVEGLSLIHISEPTRPAA